MKKMNVKKVNMKKMNMEKMKEKWDLFVVRAMHREEGLDGILVTVGLCIIALLLCVVMKDSLSTFIQNIVSALETKSNTILSGM